MIWLIVIVALLGGAVLYLLVAQRQQGATVIFNPVSLLDDVFKRGEARMEEVAGIRTPSQSAFLDAMSTKRWSEW